MDSKTIPGMGEVQNMEVDDTVINSLAPSKVCQLKYRKLLNGLCTYYNQYNIHFNGIEVVLKRERL